MKQTDMQETQKQFFDKEALVSDMARYSGFSVHTHRVNPAGGAAFDCDTVCRHVSLEAGDIVFYNQKNRRESTMAVYAPLQCAWKVESPDSILVRYQLQFKDTDNPLEICALKDEIHK